MSTLIPPLVKHITLFPLFMFLLVQCKTPKVTQRGASTIYKGQIEVIEIKEHEQSTGIIKGKIVDIRTLQIIPFGSVEVIGSQNGTMANNMGEFELFATGKVTLEFSGSGYTTMRRTFKVKAGKETLVSVKLGTSVIHCE